MRTLSPRVQALGAAAMCLVVAVAAGLAVDIRLDRNWLLRGTTLLLALACAAVLAADNKRRLRRVVAIVGMLMFGIVFPVSLTAWSRPPEIDFALTVADEARAAAEKQAQSVVTVEDVRAAAEARGGAVGSLPTEANPQPRGATAYPLIIRRDPTKGRPWACLAFTGLEAEVRSC